MPFDTFSGGIVDLRDFANSLPDFLPPINFINPRYGFIPVVSALDIKRNNGVVNPTDYLNKYAGGLMPVPALTSGFNNFIVDFNNGNLRNNEHISFQARNGNWFAEELQVNSSAPVYPSYDCSEMCLGSIEITGPAKMCTNGSIYSINLPSAIVPVWYITQGDNLVTLTTNSNGSVTLTSQQYSGTIKLSATFGNIECGFRTLEKTITIGNNSTNFRLTIVDQYCANSFHYYVLRPLSPPTNFDGFSNFTPTTGIFTTAFNGTNDVIFRVPGNFVGNASFSVLGSNTTCGKFKYSYTIGSIYDCQSIQLPRMSQSEDEKRYYVYPIPSNNLVYVNLNEAFKNSAVNSTINAELFDLYAQSKGSIRILDNSAVIDVSGLSEGIYILKIYLDDNIESHQIIVQ